MKTMLYVPEFRFLQIQIVFGIPRFWIDVTSVISQFRFLGIQLSGAYLNSSLYKCHQAPQFQFCPLLQRVEPVCSPAAYKDSPPRPAMFVVIEYIVMNLYILVFASFKCGCVNNFFPGKFHRVKVSATLSTFCEIISRSRHS